MVNKLIINFQIVQVSSGANHILILDDSGFVYVHGTGLYVVGIFKSLVSLLQLSRHGELGLGDSRLLVKDEFVQIDQITEQAPEGIQDISSGFFHNLLLTNSGDVYSFGWNKFGVLGPGMPEESLMVFEPFPMDLEKRVRSVKTGKYCSQVTYGKF